MSITGHWKATTGFDTSTYTVTMGKPVADCTDAELVAHPLCGSISPFCNVAYSATSAEMSGNYMNHLAGSCGFSDPITSGHSEQWTVPPKPSEDLRKQYRRIIFVAAPTGVTIPSRCITENADNRILIVEDIKNPNKLVINYGNTSGGSGYYSFPFTPSVRCKHTCNRGQSTWNTAPDQIEYTDPDTHTTTYYYLYPVWLYVYSNITYIIRDEFLDNFGGIYRAGEPDSNNWNYIYTSKYYQSFRQSTPVYLAMGYNPNPSDEDTTLKDLLGAAAYADPVPDPAQFITSPTPYQYPTSNLSPDGTGVIYGFLMGNSTSAGYRVCSLNIQLFKSDQWYLAGSMCRMGCYFVNNGELLKPIIEGGIVTGYGTTDQESEIDEYTDLNHPVPSTPGGGGGGGGNDEDNSDPITTIGAPFASGLAHYYVTTAASPVLQHISEAMSTWDIDATKKDLYRNLISCKLIKPPAPVPSTSGVFTIYGVKPQYKGSDITITEVTGNPTNTFGPYSISRKFNDFRDYSPYTKCEIFLPYCGWCGLPSHVVGRRVTVKYFTDIIAATCKAIVFCENNIVAEASGVIGLDIPFASENVGAKMTAANAGLLASTKGALQTALGVGTMVSTKGQKGLNTVMSGLSAYVSGFSQMSMAANENWTEISGKTGDGCNIAGASSIIIKITRPKYGANTTAPYVPANYGNSVGYVSMKTVRVSSVTGLLIADNVDTSGISGATERERAMIKAYLESGIIVNHPEP